jgi:hypothetical protein
MNRIQLIQLIPDQIEDRLMALNIDQHYENIFLVEKKDDTLASEITETLPGWKICACDLHVSGSEAGKVWPSLAIDFDDLLIIDHHMPLPEMRQFISSTQIANNYVLLNGPLSKEYAIVINHVDTDSVLSALIMNGTLAPDELLVQAAQNADHFGRMNIISDVLQALQDERNLRNSIEISPLLPILYKILAQRYADRLEIQEYIAQDLVHWEDSLAYVRLEHIIDVGLLPDLLPDARVIVFACPMQEANAKKWYIRLRLGQPGAGLDLRQMNLPEFRGRWNAGAIAGDTGTDREPEEFIRLIREALTNG